MKTPTLLVVTITSALAFGAMSPRASAQPLWDAELRLGYGLEIAGSQGMAAPRSAPLTLGGIAAVAINDDPPLYGFGGFVVETLDRSAVGATGGIMFASGRLRLKAGGVWLFAPYTLWGVAASGGACGRIGSGMRMCGDLELTQYFAGTDLVKGSAVTQGQFVLGLVFDGT